MKCIYEKIIDPICQLNSKKEYGGYCYKHRKEHLLQDNLIILKRFTGKSKDYTLPQLRNFHKHYLRKTSKEKVSKYKKNELFAIIDEYYKNTKYSYINIESLTKFQSAIRKRLIRNKIKYQGLGILNRSVCRNDEDFCTYDPKEEIDEKYFFSYKDTSNNYWCFDIRSVKKLIDMNYGNPYTMDPIPDNIKNKINNLINHLRGRGIQVSVDTAVITDRQTQVKQSFVDIFAQIEYAGYSCNVDWVLNLSSVRLKKLYRELEDIWNYRAGLSQQVKSDIVPPDGRLFVMPVQDYMSCNVKLELQEILVKELKKILGARTVSDMNLGFMYFIMGLSMVSRECLMIHPWVQYAF